MLQHSNQSFSNIISDEFKLGISDLYRRHLKEVLVFSETMRNINFPNAALFYSIVENKLARLDQYNPYTTQVAELEKHKALTENSDEKKEIDEAIKREIYSGYISHCTTVIADLSLIFNDYFWNLLDNEQTLETLGLDCFLYITSVKSQINYSQFYAHVMQLLPIAERMTLPMFPPEHENFSKARLPDSYALKGAILAGNATSRAVKNIAPLTPHFITNTVKSYLPEVVNLFGTSAVDELFLATEEFSRKNRFFSNRVYENHKINSYDFSNVQLKKMHLGFENPNIIKSATSFFNAVSNIMQQGLIQESLVEMLNSGGDLIKEAARLVETKPEWNEDDFLSIVKEHINIFGDTHFPQAQQTIKILTDILAMPELKGAINTPEFIAINYTNNMIELAQQFVKIMSENKAFFIEEDIIKVLIPLKQAMADWAPIQSQYSKYQSISLDIEQKIEYNKKELAKLMEKKNDSKPNLFLEKQINKIENNIKNLKSEYENLSRAPWLNEAKQKMDFVIEQCRKGFWLAAYNLQTPAEKGPFVERLKVIAELVMSNINWTLYPKYIIDGLTRSLQASYLTTFSSHANYLYGLYNVQKTLKKIETFEKLKTKHDFLEIDSFLSNELTDVKHKSFKKGKNTLISQDSQPTVATKLYIHSSGGGGHTAAMKAKVQEDMEQAQCAGMDLTHVKPATIDLMLDWLGFVGALSVKAWNDAQKTADIQKQEALVAQQPLGNLVFGNVIYYKMYNFLVENQHINDVVCTQAMCVPSICQAILDFNRAYNKNIKMTLVMTDLPTEKAVHFWNGLNSLTSAQRSIITVETVEPIISDFCYSENTHQLAQSKINTISYDAVAYERFFERLCGPGIKFLIVPPPIRKEFKAGNHRTRDEINGNSLTFSFSNPQEKEVFSENNCFLDSFRGAASIHVNETDRVASVMLGSQGSKALLDYVETFVHSHTPSEKGGKTLLFVYCGPGQKETPSELFTQVQNLIKKLKKENKISKDLLIYPLGMQEALSIAENYARNDLTDIRSGGLASMEALECAKENKQNQFFIHSEGKSDDVDELRKAIPVWEGGNAAYLEAKIGAQIVNPKRFGEILKTARDQAVAKQASPFLSFSHGHQQETIQQKECVEEVVKQEECNDYIDDYDDLRMEGCRLM